MTNENRDKNKKDDGNKLEDKGNSNTGTADGHVGEAASDQDKTRVCSNASSINVHISNITRTTVALTQSVQDILAAHSIDHPILDQTISTTS